jgi:hypothetical protein
MQIISERKMVETPCYEIFFQWKDSAPNHGFGFPGLASGEIDMVELQKKPAALANYNKCISGEYAVTGPEFKSWIHHYSEPAIGRCSCGCEVELYGFTNTCDKCGRDYNMSGQALAPRSQWGEETGESYCDLQDL